MSSSEQNITSRTVDSHRDAKRTMGHYSWGFLYGPLPTGEYILVAIDRYSRYPEVEVVRSTKASTVIPTLDQIDICSSWNPNYDQVLGIKALYSTPKWPQGNAEAERFMLLILQRNNDQNTAEILEIYVLIRKEQKRNKNVYKRPQYKRPQY